MPAGEDLGGGRALAVFVCGGPPARFESAWERTQVRAMMPEDALPGGSETKSKYVAMLPGGAPLGGMPLQERSRPENVGCPSARERRRRKRCRRERASAPHCMGRPLLTEDVSGSDGCGGRGWGGDRGGWGRKRRGGRRRRRRRRGRTVIWKMSKVVAQFTVGQFRFTIISSYQFGHIILILSLL